MTSGRGCSNNGRDSRVEDPAGWRAFEIRPSGRVHLTPTHDTKLASQREGAEMGATSDAEATIFQVKIGLIGVAKPPV